jgi:SAM-dependent methyltransferase
VTDPGPPRAAPRRLRRALRHWLVPGLESSQLRFEEYLWRHGVPSQAWLDLGCGHRMLHEARQDAERALLSRARFVVGVDLDLAALRRNGSIRWRAVASADRLPFADRAFDVVTANMVVEHLDDPARQFAEVARVLRPGGVFLVHTPNRAGYYVRVARLLPYALKRALSRVLDGRAGADVYPTYYRANTRAGLAAAAAGAGLELVSVETVLSSPALQAVPPLAVLELLLIRQLRRPALADWRPNLIGVLRKPAEAPRTA